MRGPAYGILLARLYPYAPAQRQMENPGQR
jgi:hypothetical protein